MNDRPVSPALKAALMSRGSLPEVPRPSPAGNVQVATGGVIPRGQAGQIRPILEPGTSYLPVRKS